MALGAEVDRRDAGSRTNDARPAFFQLAADRRARHGIACRRPHLARLDASFVNFVREHGPVLQRRVVERISTDLPNSPWRVWGNLQPQNDATVVYRYRDGHPHRRFETVTYREGATTMSACPRHAQSSLCAPHGERAVDAVMNAAASAWRSLAAFASDIKRNSSQIGPDLYCANLGPSRAIDERAACSPVHSRDVPDQHDAQDVSTRSAARRPSHGIQASELPR